MINSIILYEITEKKENVSLQKKQSFQNKTKGHLTT